MKAAGSVVVRLCNICSPFPDPFRLGFWARSHVHLLLLWLGCDNWFRWCPFVALHASCNIGDGIESLAQLFLLGRIRRQLHGLHEIFCRSKRLLESIFFGCRSLDLQLMILCEK